MKDLSPISSLHIVSQTDQLLLRVDFAQQQEQIHVHIDDFWSEPGQPYRAIGTISMTDYEKLTKKVLQAIPTQQADLPTADRLQLVIKQEASTDHTETSIFTLPDRPVVQNIRHFVDQQGQSSRFRLQVLDVQQQPVKGLGWLILLAVLLPYALFVWGVDMLRAGCSP